MFAQAILESASAAARSVSRAGVAGEVSGEASGEVGGEANGELDANRGCDDRKRALTESDETRRGRKRRVSQHRSTDTLERVDSDSLTSLGNEDAVEAATRVAEEGASSTDPSSMPALLSAPAPPRALSHMEAAAAAAESARAAAAAALAAARSEGSDEADCGECEEQDDDGNDDDSRSTTSGSHSGQRRRDEQRVDEQRRDGQRRERCLLFGCKTKLLRCSGVKVIGSPIGCAKNGHVLCAPCLDRWFSAQNSLREDSGLLPLARRSCPVCKTELRGTGGECRGDARHYFLGLQKLEWSWQGHDETILRRTPS